MLRGVALTNCIQYMAKVLNSKGPKIPEKKMESEYHGYIYIYTLCTTYLQGFHEILCSGLKGLALTKKKKRTDWSKTLNP